MSREKDPSKAFRKKLRKLSSLAHAKELDRELRGLADHFDRWKAHQISSGELSDLIHEFHDGPSRELWKFYNYSKPEAVVARSIAQRILDEEEVGPDVMKKLDREIRAFIKALERKDSLVGPSVDEQHSSDGT